MNPSFNTNKYLKCQKQLACYGSLNELLGVVKHVSRIPTKYRSWGGQKERAE